MLKRRVVVTGIGIVSSIGIGRKQFWLSLTRGKNGISRVSSFDTTEYGCHYGGEVRGFRIEDWIAIENAKSLSRSSQFALVASDLAVKDC